MELNFIVSFSSWQGKRLWGIKFADRLVRRARIAPSSVCFMILVIPRGLQFKILFKFRIFFLT